MRTTQVWTDLRRKLGKRRRRKRQKDGSWDQAAMNNIKSFVHAVGFSRKYLFAGRLRCLSVSHWRRGEIEEIESSGWPYSARSETQGMSQLHNNIAVLCRGRNLHRNTIDMRTSWPHQHSHLNQSACEVWWCEWKPERVGDSACHLPKWPEGGKSLLVTNYTLSNSTPSCLWFFDKKSSFAYH